MPISTSSRASTSHSNARRRPRFLCNSQSRFGGLRAISASRNVSVFCRLRCMAKEPRESAGSKCSAKPPNDAATCWDRSGDGENAVRSPAAGGQPEAQRRGPASATPPNSDTSTYPPRNGSMSHGMAPLEFSAGLNRGQLPATRRSCRLNNRRLVTPVGRQKPQANPEQKGSTAQAGGEQSSNAWHGRRSSKRRRNGR